MNRVGKYLGLPTVFLSVFYVCPLNCRKPLEYGNSVFYCILLVEVWIIITYHTGQSQSGLSRPILWLSILLSFFSSTYYLSKPFLWFSLFGRELIFHAIAPLTSFYCRHRKNTTSSVSYSQILLFLMWNWRCLSLASDPQVQSFSYGAPIVHVVEQFFTSQPNDGEW